MKKRREMKLPFGVTLEQTSLAKHAVCIVTFNGKSRRLVYPKSGSDARGPLNHRQDIRGALRELGATKQERQRSAAPKRRRCRSTKRPPPSPTPGPARADKWESRLKLVAESMAAPPAVEAIAHQAPLPAPTPTLWQRIMARLAR